MRTLFISDLHLNTDAPEITQGFLRYLQQTASGAESLFILGDLFDAWIGDDLLDQAGLPLADIAHEVIHGLRELTDNGTRVFLMHGNRDFLLGDRFIQACGATLLQDSAYMELQGIPLLLLHGDSLCTRDEAYMAFREQARNPAWQAQILALPLDQRLELAKSLRLQSGEANADKTEAIMDVTHEEVVDSMAHYGVASMIHGHTHRPQVHALSVDGVPAKRYVLGDWSREYGWDIVIDGFENAHPEPQLRQFPLQEPPQ
ncbi:UDP-2,3-diacylglucosamine diphosphatase [Vreelandella rituensis]|uniref:UDP-2,3-diacylglucosamine hydrolase n=1 Tax=Vreelandella rituensis TaxID=2282306 RepID=A0A368UCL8_9GAMM|nr:UDP-2,3-diacylglucosamine diphosphatase [Halomonas rituensis]RCV93343.1 UDP-2,3-diacylglucosamine diphosphatase [Halomonas rituensis]